MHETTDMTVQLFGPYAAAVGSGSVRVAVEGDEPVTVEQLLKQLGETEPRLSSLLPGARLAVNCRYALPHETVTADDELALIGLVNGG